MMRDPGLRARGVPVFWDSRYLKRTGAPSSARTATTLVPRDPESAMRKAELLIQAGETGLVEDTPRKDAAVGRSTAAGAWWDFCTMAKAPLVRLQLAA